VGVDMVAEALGGNEVDQGGNVAPAHGVKRSGLDLLVLIVHLDAELGIGIKGCGHIVQLGNETRRNMGDVEDLFLCIGRGRDQIRSRYELRGIADTL